MKNQYRRVKRSRRQEGFSFVEVLVTMLLLSIIAAIAIPKYTAAMNRDNYTIAQADGENLYREITDALSSTTNFGSTNGTIAYSSGTGLLTITLGTGGVSPSPFSEAIDSSASITGKTYGSTLNWCIAVVDGVATVVYNQDGFQTGVTVCP